MKIDSTVKNETIYVALFTLILSALMQAVFLVAGAWSISVLLGNLLGFAIGVGNFFLMGLGVQAALNKEEKEAKNLIKLSQRLRLIFVLALAALGASLSVFNTYSTLIPIFFPSLAVRLRPFIKRNEETQSNEK